MGKIITIDSFRGGTGKSTITANLAVYLASLGNKVLIIDTDVKSPGVHALFGLHEGNLKSTFNDFLTGEAEIEETVYDVTEIVSLKQGKLFLTPSSIHYGEIANTLVAKYSTSLMEKAFKKLIKKFDLDYLIADTHPGLNNETLLAAEQSDALFLLIRPDNQDYQGAKVWTQIAKRLNIKTYLVLNKIHSKIDPKSLKKELENVFGFPVVAAIPFTEDLLIAESSYVFYEKHPHHKFSKEIKKIVAEIITRHPANTLETRK